MSIFVEKVSTSNKMPFPGRLGKIAIYSLLSAAVILSMQLFLVDRREIYIQLSEMSTNCPTNQSSNKELDCNCARNKKLILVPSHQALSTCGQFSTARGGNQKIVSFSFYGNTSSIYFKEVEPTILNVQKFYPDWVMRLYHNINTSDPVQNDELCKFWCKYHHLDLCDATRLPYPLCDKSKVFGMIWRFFPLGDSLVERFIVRDLDSPMLQREVDAVNDWILSNKTFHLMRDNPGHWTSILGGLWGAANLNLSLMQKFRSEFISQGSLWKYGNDQELLTSIMWPTVVQDSIVHDSFYCRKFKNTIPFPTRRDNYTFVGMRQEKFRLFKLPPAKCPVECRPLEHKDWDYC